MAKPRFATGYLKWDGKKYVLESTLTSVDNKIIVNIDNDNSKILYFSNGKCEIIQK
jgi:hypothetical protein